MAYIFGNKWTETEKKIAMRFLKKKLYMVKDYLDKSYVIYDKSLNKYPSMQNIVIESKSLKKLEDWLDGKINKKIKSKSYRIKNKGLKTSIVKL